MAWTQYTGSLGHQSSQVDTLHYSTSLSSVCVCVCVHVRVRVRVCMGACMCVCVHACVHECMHVHSAYMCMCSFLCYLYPATLCLPRRNAKRQSFLRVGGEICELAALTNPREPHQHRWGRGREGYRLWLSRQSGNVLRFNAPLPQNSVRCQASSVAMDCIRWCVTSSWHSTAEGMWSVSVSEWWPSTSRERVSQL